MRRFVFTVAALLLACVLGAQNAHALAKFTSARAFPTDGNLTPAKAGSPPGDSFHGGLMVEFTEVGVGSGNVNYQVTATATAVYRCANKGGNKPNAENKITVTAPTSASGTAAADKNGKIIGSLSIPPLPFPAGSSCPPGQSPVLSAVSYTNVVLTDLTNNVSISIPGTFSLEEIVLP